MHFYKFHIGDYMSHTRHLSLMEDLAYRRLLDFYFLHEQPIKHRDAARHIGMRDHEEDVLTVLNEFFLSTDDGFVNPRANKEIEEFKKHQAVSAYGAFVRDNPSIKELSTKEEYVIHYLNGSIDVYIGTLRGNDVQRMGTSSVHDAPLTSNHNHNHNHKPEREGTRMSEDWFLSKALGEWASKERPDMDIRKEAEQFKDFWLGQTDDKGYRKDWSAVWRHWIRGGKATKPNPADIIRLTVPSKNEPDPALEKIKADSLKAVPPPLEVLAKMAQLRSKA
jgi:uncharacterized protein YdaU (DUF1376 family)